MSKWSKKYYHRDGKQLRFYKKAHIKHRAKTRMYLYFLYCKLSSTNSNIFDKTCTQEYVK